MKSAYLKSYVFNDIPFNNLATLKRYLRANKISKAEIEVSSYRRGSGKLEMLDYLTISVKPNTRK